MLLLNYEICLEVDSAVRDVGSERCVAVHGADSEAAAALVDCKPNWWRQMAHTACYLFVLPETLLFACYLFSCTFVQNSNISAMKQKASNSMYNSQETPPDSQWKYINAHWEFYFFFLHLLIKAQ